MWKSLHAAAFYTPGSPLTVPADSTGVSWSGLSPRLFPAHCRKVAPHRANRPHRKIPGTRSGMPGIFLFRSDGDHTGGVLPLSTAAAAEGGKLSPMRAFAGRRRSAHRPAHPRRTAARGRTAPGKLPPSENPRHSLWNAGDFLSIYSCCTGVTSARRSHGLPL